MREESSFHKMSNKVLDTIKNPSSSTVTVLSMAGVVAVAGALMYFAGATFAMPVLVISPTITK